LNILGKSASYLNLLAFQVRIFKLYPNLIGTKTWIKHENHQPVGAFKVRGGLNLAANLTEEE